MAKPKGNTSKKEETLQIEMYYGIMEGDLGVWHTDYVEIPLTTPKIRMEEVAKKEFLKSREKNKVEICFCGIYSINYNRD